MIRLGFTDDEKRACIGRYCATRGIRKIFAFSPSKFALALPGPVPSEHIEWGEIIQYKFFYRLLQEIDPSTLLVINECLRTQNRHELTYNCLRNFLNVTPHQAIFQALPIIDSPEDFMILVDFDTRSRWKRERWRPEFRETIDIGGVRLTPTLSTIDVPTDEKTSAAYQVMKRKLIDGIGNRDPHTIPRNLYLMAGKAKLAYVDHGMAYLGRNNRFGLPRFSSYRDEAFPDMCDVFELPHDSIRLADFIALSRQPNLRVLASDLKVDRWYVDRLNAWIRRLHDAYSAIQL